jgi:NADH-quinone oxidoreductase subunit G
VVKPLGETRPAWKVWRVLANMMSLPGFESDSSQEVLNKILGKTAGVTEIPADQLMNATTAQIDLTLVKGDEPVTASIYQLDGMVRRASSLQMTADARAEDAHMPAQSKEVLS